MTLILRDLINLYVLPIGRRQYALKEIARRLSAAEHEALAAEALGVVAFDAETRTLIRRQAEQASQKSNPLLAPADASVDRGVGAVLRVAQNAVANLEPELAAQAQAFIDDLFPRGATAITLLSYEEEVEAVDDLLESIDANYSELIGAIGAAPFVTRLRALNATFRDLLEARPNITLQPRLAQTRQTEAHEQLLSLVVGITALHRTRSNEDTQALNYLLQPLLVQNARLADAYKRHRTVLDVNEDTGEELPADPLAPSPASPPPTA